MSLLQADPAQRPEMARAVAGLAAVARDAGAVAWQPQTPAGAAQPPSAGDQTSSPRASGPRTQPGFRQVPERAPRPAPPVGTGGDRNGRDRNRRRVLLIAGLVAVALTLGGLGLASMLDRPTVPDPVRAPGPPAVTGPSPTPQESPPKPSPPAPAQPAAPDLSSGPIEWSAAGELVIDYYNGLDDPDSAWQMLSPSAQQSFGSQAGFREYWSRYEEVSARNAQGVTVNDDGSVDVPVDVAYSADGNSRQEQRVLRITEQDGQLLIASEAR